MAQEHEKHQIIRVASIARIRFEAIALDWVGGRCS